MLNVCGTFAAALKFALPACAAVIVQEPAPVRCTVPGDGLVTVHCPLALKLIGKPDDADALTMKSGSPSVLLANAPNVIVWFPFVLVRLKFAVGKPAPRLARTLYG